VGCTVDQKAKYKMVRLRGATHARLKALRDRLFAAYQMGSLPLPDEQADQLALDYVVNRLLDHFDAHAKRRARSRQKS